MRRIDFGEWIVPGVTLVYVVLYIAQTFHLPFRTVAYPFSVIGILVVLLAVFALQQVYLSRERPGDGESERKPSDLLSFYGIRGKVTSNFKILSVIVLTLAYVFVIQYFGFFFTSLAFLIALFLIFRTARPLYMVPATFVFVLAVKYGLMDVVRLSFPSFAFTDLPFGI